MTASSCSSATSSGAELVEVRAGQLEPSRKRIAADDGRAERALGHRSILEVVSHFSVESLSYEQVAKTIDHSLLRPELD